MKKFGYVLAAVGALAVALPTLASAETVVIKRGGHITACMAPAPNMACIATTAGIAAGTITTGSWWSSVVTVTIGTNAQRNTEMAPHGAISLRVRNVRRG